jgi:PPOX class probable F420-dependent enzyme
VSAVDRFAASVVARLATVGDDGAPHIVPITFVATQQRIHTPVDHKPKRTTRLRRLANIAHDPRVSVLADHYEDDWRNLWWVRVDGVATVLSAGSNAHSEASRSLAAKYDEYRTTPIAGPIIEIAALHWSSWAAQSASTRGA